MFVRMKHRYASCGRADDGLAAHVERRVDDDGHAGDLLELRDQVVVERALARGSPSAGAPSCPRG